MAIAEPISLIVRPGEGAEGASLPLSRLEEGLCAMVTAVEAADDDLHRLQAMGVCEGRRVELVKRGDPLILRVFGSRLGVSGRLAAMILVEPCHDPHCAESAPELKAEPERA